jgi:hypothetical protein
LHHSKKNPVINAGLLLGAFPGAGIARWPLTAQISLTFICIFVLKLFLANPSAFVVLLLRFCLRK